MLDQIKRKRIRRQNLITEYQITEKSGDILKDVSPEQNDLDLINNPIFENGSLIFNGISQYGQQNNDFNFGTKNFTIGFFINTENILVDKLGDLLSKYNPETKNGINLGLLSNSAYSSQSNFRNLFFGIDNNHSDDALIQAEPQYGSENYIRSLAVYNGKLYGGTGPNANLLEWKTGVATSYHFNINPGRQNIIAIKDDNVLKLYLNGELINTSDTFDKNDYDLDNIINTIIGFGQQDYFNGKIEYIFIYDRDIKNNEIKRFIHLIEQSKY